jgi:hypothetical protein
VRGTLLFDDDGRVARAYQVRTTPQAFVIDARGNLVYRGGFDDAPGRADTRVNHVEQALADLRAGRPVRTPETRSYGTSIE